MAKGYYAVLRGRQPGVYSSRFSAEAQVRCFSNAYQRGFDTRKEAEWWLTNELQERIPYYESRHSTTKTHRIWPRYDSPCDEVFLLQCDGASRGNPGPSGCGGLICEPDTGNRVADYQHYCDHGTNNVAEYRGLIRGLALALGLGIRNLEVQCDSELIVNQSCGVWATHHPVLAYYRDIAQCLLHQFAWWDLTAIPRHLNTDADELANAAIDDESDGNVRLYGDADYIRDAADDDEVVHRVVNKFAQYELSSAHILMYYPAQSESDRPGWLRSDDDDDDDNDDNYLDL